MQFNVLSPGFLASIQDRGRPGFAHAGVPCGGVMDWVALEVANRIVGNEPGMAVIECYGDGPDLLADGTCLLAGAGRGFELEVSGRRLPPWLAVRLQKGERVHLAPARGEAAIWGYLAVSGGFDLPPVMGSRSTDLRGGFGGLAGRYLREGDMLPVGNFPTKALNRVGARLVSTAIPEYGDRVVLGAVPGPQAGMFTHEAMGQFWSGEYHLSLSSDRMGYRLEGPPLELEDKEELLSEGVVPGAVQVLPSGQAVVLMAAAQTTGGYPKIAVVARASQPALAQMLPGKEVLKFEHITTTEARRSLQDMRPTLLHGILIADEDESIY